jgi:hypothetical protein
MNTDRFENLTRRLVDPRGSRRMVLRLAGALALPGLRMLVSAAARAAADVPDAFCPPPATVYGYGSHRFAQTFKAQATGLLTRVTINAIAAGPTKFEIRKTTSRGKPGKTVLASAIVDDIIRPLVSQTTPVTVGFTPGARVKMDELYALVITGVGGSLPNVQANSDPGCAGTLFDDDNLDKKFRKVSGYDIVFATYLTPS